MKVRVFEKEDGTKVVDVPSKKYQGGTFIECFDKPIIGKKKKIVAFEEVSVKTEEGECKREDKTKPIYKEFDVVVGFEKRELTLDDCKIPEQLKGCRFTIEDR